MEKHTIYGLLIVVTLVFCLSAVPSAIAASDEEEVLQVATDFVKAFSTSDFELMSSLHLDSPKQSKFTPPPTGAFLNQGWERIAKGFKAELASPPGTYMFSTHNLQATMLTKDVAFTTQYMTLLFTDPSTEEQSVEHIRQTLIMQKIDGKWLIVHEHSSFLPIE